MIEILIKVKHFFDLSVNDILELWRMSRITNEHVQPERWGKSMCLASEAVAREMGLAKLLL